jgi:tetratricopeptide (TPR) repeat protein
MRILGLLLLFLLPAMSMAQVTDEQLASHYYQEGDFEKAAMYYKRLHEQQPSTDYYKFYLNCLYELERFKEVKDVIKRQIRVFPRELQYQVDLGSYYRKVKDDKRAEKEFESIIQDMRPRFNDIQDASKTLQAIGETEFALKALMKGRKILPAYPFNIEIASLYGEMGNTEAMIDELISLVELSPNYLQTVQNALGRNISMDNVDERNLLKAELYKKIQQRPNEDIYVELLTWVLIQEGDFESVYRQTTALDRRRKENGYRLMELSSLSLNSKNFDVAVKSLQYVIDKGSESELFEAAKMEMMEVLYEKVKSDPRAGEEEALKLEARYLEMLNELGYKRSTLRLQHQLAEVQAFYLNQNEKASAVLQRALEIPGSSSQQQAEAKLLLADIYILDEKEWDASLLYMQVEKDFKYDRLGEIAKFKNAQVYYYKGEFELARVMLDVLKGSTSKLISNDAMELSLLITDNTLIDTTVTPLKMFARADLLRAQNHDDEALLLLDSINAQFPYHALSDEILMRRAEIAFDKAEFNSTEKFLLEVVNLFPTDILADNAIYELAQLYDYYLDSPEKAMEYYKMLITDYKDSLFVVEARKRFRSLRGDQIN